MKFKQYILENTVASVIDNVDDFNWSLHRNCKPYLQMIKSLSHPFIREMLVDPIMGIKIVRPDRKPRGTDPKVFKQFNDWLQKNGHNRRDNSVMASFEKSDVFGAPYYIFPMGKFSYSWIEANDVNMSDSFTGWDNEALNDYDFDSDFSDAIGSQRLKKPFKDYFTTDSGYDVAARHGYEIWFKCKRYLFVDYSKFKWDKATQTVVNK